MRDLLMIFEASCPSVSLVSVICPELASTWNPKGYTSTLLLVCQIGLLSHLQVLVHKNFNIRTFFLQDKISNWNSLGMVLYGIKFICLFHAPWRINFRGL